MTTTEGPDRRLLIGVAVLAAIGIAGFVTVGLAAGRGGGDSRSMERSEVPLTMVAHAIRVPVRVNDSVDAQFLLDTGIGFEIVSKALADRLGCVVDGEHRGKRMSGQELAVPLSRVASLAVGGRRAENVRVGLWDMTGLLPPSFGPVDGFLSLAFFEKVPFTIDFPSGCVVLESEASLAARRAKGTVLPLRLDRDGPSLGAFLSMDVGAKEPAVVEVDTGSDGLILDLRYMPLFGLVPGAPGVTSRSGKDETGHEFVRHVAKMPSPIFPAGARALALEGSPVLFQKIIYDGLVGTGYLKAFAVTFDLPRSELILARPGAAETEGRPK